MKGRTNLSGPCAPQRHPLDAGEPTTRGKLPLQMKLFKAPGSARITSDKAIAAVQSTESHIAVVSEHHAPDFARSADRTPDEGKD